MIRTMKNTCDLSRVLATTDTHGRTFKHERQIQNCSSRYKSWVVWNSSSVCGTKASLGCIRVQFYGSKLPSELRLFRSWYRRFISWVTETSLMGLFLPGTKPMDSVAVHSKIYWPRSHFHNLLSRYWTEFHLDLESCPTLFGNSAQKQLCWQ